MAGPFIQGVLDHLPLLFPTLLLLNSLSHTAMEDFSLLLIPVQLFPALVAVLEIYVLLT